MFARKSEEGFSLIEVLIAFALVTIVMLALLESVVLYSQVGMRNILRDEAVRATQDVLNELRSRDYNSLTAGTTNLTVTKPIRSAKWNYAVEVVVTDSATAKSVQATTTWEFQGTHYSHSASTMIPPTNKD